MSRDVGDARTSGTFRTLGTPGRPGCRGHQGRRGRQEDQNFTPHLVSVFLVFGCLEMPIVKSFGGKFMFTKVTLQLLRSELESVKNQVCRHLVILAEPANIGQMSGRRRANVRQTSGKRQANIRQTSGTSELISGRRRTNVGHFGQGLGGRKIKHKLLEVQRCGKN